VRLEVALSWVLGQPIRLPAAEPVDWHNSEVLQVTLHEVATTMCLSYDII
jgi:hypothetical protein